jgi:lipopolysaccharide biosynthesis glycosyltransferase
MPKTVSTPSLNLALAVDEGYLGGLAGTLVGIARGCPYARIHTYILDCGVTDESWRDFTQVLSAYSKNFDFHRLVIEDSTLIRFAPDIRSRGLNNSTYARFLLPELLPDTDRILYLDCDLLIDADLGPLMSTDLAGALIGAVEDDHTPLLGGNVNPALLSPAEIQLPAFNAGVILMDLAALRRADLIAPVIDLIPQMQSRLQSQAVLNYVLKNRWQALPKKWNRQRFVTENFSIYRDHPQSIWHFIGKMKPWHFAPGQQRGLVADFNLNARLSGWRSRQQGSHRPLSSPWRDQAKACYAFALRHTRHITRNLVS